jgi:hypothetical protein
MSTVKKKVGPSFGSSAPKPAASSGSPEATGTSVTVVPMPVPAMSSSLPSAQHHDRRGEILSRVHKNCATRVEFVGEISRLWNESQHRFIEIGRYLAEAKERLEHGEFMPMIESDLPFGHKVAVKLMAVAKAVDEGIFPPKDLPSSYSTVYELISLKEDERARAVEAGIVRCDVSREEIVRFKHQIRAERQEGAPKAFVSAATLRRRLKKLLAEREELDRQIQDIESQLGEGATAVN